MALKLSSFSHKIFRAYLLSTVLANSFIFVLVLIFCLVFFDWSLSELLSFSSFFVVASFAVSLFSAWRWSEPLRRVTEKVQRLSSRRLARELGPLSEEEIFEFEDGELSDLEQAIDRMHRKYQANQELLRTEREESQALMGSVQEALVTVDRQFNLLYFNSRFFSNYMSKAQLGRTVALSEVFRQPEIQAAFQKGLGGEVEKRTVQFQNVGENSLRYYSLSVNPLKKATGEVYGALGVFYDITELKRADQVRIDFVANASHELRTPLTAVKGYLETVREDINNNMYDQVPKFLTIISRNVDRLIELMNDLLNLSALDSGSGLQLSEFNPTELTQSIVEDMSSLSEEKRQMIIVKSDIDSLRADVKKVEQVIRNLLANAIKYTQEGGQIQLSWCVESRGDMVTFRVKDNGPGIAPEHHSRLFERFYRIDKGRAREFGGTGLGLAIVKHIMQIHGGQVRLISALGQGSEFVCEFPV